MVVLETERLCVRWMNEDDAPFILELLNEPSFIQYIADRGIRDLEGAREYIRKTAMASYEQHGFGLFLVVLKATGEPMGMSGLLRRETLPDVDVGFAFLPRYWSKGYAYESAAAIMAWGREHHDLHRFLAITAMENPSSIALLERLGFKFDEILQFTPESPPLRLFSVAQ